jgi:four helix bundle protein
MRVWPSGSSVWRGVGAIRVCGMSDEGRKPPRSSRDLLAWQKGMDLVVDLYKLGLRWPRSERSGLIRQMRRAPHSIPRNPAEGCGRRRRGAYVRCLGMAFGSWCELETEIIASGRRGFTSRRDAAPVWGLCQEAAKFPCALRVSLASSTRLTLEFLPYTLYPRP